MKTNKQKIAAVISVLLIFTMIFAGCVKSREKSTDAKIGAVTLSINPEIKIEYNKISRHKRRRKSSCTKSCKL